MMQPMSVCLHLSSLWFRHLGQSAAEVTDALEAAEKFPELKEGDDYAALLELKYKTQERTPKKKMVSAVAKVSATRKVSAVAVKKTATATVRSPLPPRAKHGGTMNLPALARSSVLHSRRLGCRAPGCPEGREHRESGGGSEEEEEGTGVMARARVVCVRV